MTRADWPPMPPAIATLPTQEGTGYPIPWFVETVDGKPDFRMMSGKNFVRAVKEHRCWVCGRVMLNLTRGSQRQGTFVIGPMCAVNRVSAEPPAHHACAEWSARVCPFLTTPGRARREAHMPDHKVSGGVAITRNPGVALLWSSTTWTLRKVDNGYLFDIGDPYKVAWLCEGRPATRAEVDASIAEGLPALAGVAAGQPGAAEALAEMVAAVAPLLPAP